MSNRRLAAFAIAVGLAACGALASSRPATAINGCFNFINSAAYWFPNPDDPLGGNWTCAGTSSSTCQECFDTNPGGGLSPNDCISDSSGFQTCRFFD